MSAADSSSRRPRASVVATFGTLALGAEYVAGGWVGYRLLRDDVGSGFVASVASTSVRPFFGGRLLPDVRLEDVLPWLAGFGVAVLVCWPLAWLAARKGAWSAFVGTWFAAMTAGCAGTVLSAWVWASQNQVPDGPGLQQLYLAALDLGLRWGFLFGWAPALVASLLAAVVRTRPAPAGSADAASFYDEDSSLLLELSSAGEPDRR